jgi:hypothetical protein
LPETDAFKEGWMKPYINSRSLVIISAIVIIVTSVLVFMTRLSFIDELVLTVGMISLALFLFLFLGLFYGLGIKDHHVPDNWRNIYAGKLKGGQLGNVGDALGSLGSANGDCEVVIWILITILAILILIVLAAVFIWFVFFLMFVLYWLFYSAYRQVFRHAFICQGNARESLKYATLYTSLYTGWLLFVLLSIDLGIVISHLFG